MSTSLPSFSKYRVAAIQYEPILGEKEKNMTALLHLVEEAAQHEAHAGWTVVNEVIYRQHPFWSVWVLMKPIWKKLDYEGFYGVILKRDRTWAQLYQS